MREDAYQVTLRSTTRGAIFNSSCGRVNPIVSTEGQQQLAAEIRKFLELNESLGASQAEILSRKEALGARFQSEIMIWNSDGRVSDEQKAYEKALERIENILAESSAMQIEFDNKRTPLIEEIRSGSNADLDLDKMLDLYSQLSQLVDGALTHFIPRQFALVDEYESAVHELERIVGAE